MADATYTPKTYREQGGDRMVIASGGSFDVESSGELDIESGGALKIAGTDVTAALSEAAVTGNLTANTTVALDVLAIPITHEYVAKTTGGDAEALTLADGAPGQVLIVNLTTDGGGDGTLTPTTATGFATIVFADAGDQAVLKFIDETVGWVIVGLTGVAAPPAITV